MEEKEVGVYEINSHFYWQVSPQDKIKQASDVIIAEAISRSTRSMKASMESTLTPVPVHLEAFFIVAQISLGRYTSWCDSFRGSTGYPRGGSGGD